MGKPSNFDIRLTTALDQLTKAIEQIEITPEFTKHYTCLKPDLTNSRNFHEVILDGLLGAYINMTYKLKVSEVPLEPYRRLLETRYKMTATLEEANSELRDARKRERNAKPVFAPEFVTIFENSPIAAVVEIMPLWKAVITCLGDVTQTEQSFSVTTRMQRYLERTVGHFEKNYVEKEDGSLQKKEDARSGEFASDELNRLMLRAENLEMSPAAMKRLRSDFERMDKMHPQSADYCSAIKPLLMILDLPWNKRTAQTFSIAEAETRMNEKHFGLDKVKRVIAEHIAVQKRTGLPGGKILCLDGAPGIGKTSLAETIAHATGRKLVRVALGGMRDVVDIRGHSSTYINAQAGRIMKAMAEAGTRNPIILLDEIDKLDSKSNNAGEVASALLEALDPEQNKRFKDTFLDIDFDLSEVMFIATSNDKSKIMPALYDRMEMINLPSYSVAEKLEIAQRHLLPRQREKTGISEANMTVTTDTLKLIIDDYVSEPGVRELDRLLEVLCRKSAYKLETGSATSLTIDEKNLSDFLGKPPLGCLKLAPPDSIGMVNGLAVAGEIGSLLQFEAVAYEGATRGFSVKSTGRMGEVMTESVDVITSWIKANAKNYGVQNLDEINIHIDAPECVRKDGPSAGVAMVSVAMSVLTGKKLRGDIAMTGQMSLRGRVLEIGGTIAKLEGAMKAGMTTVLIPMANASDLAEASEDIKKALNIIPVANIDDVLKHVFSEARPKALTFDRLSASSVREEQAPLPVPISRQPSQSPS